MSDKKGFLFYYNWEDQLLKMNFEERWSFIHNLIKFHTEREITFVSEKEEMAWIGILPALKINIEKYEQRAERSRENGKKHVGNKSTNQISKQITQQVILEPKEPDNSKYLIDNIKEIIDNSKQEIKNRELTIENNKLEIETRNNELTLFEKLNSIPNWEDKLSNNGSGWIIDELMKLYRITGEELNEIVKLYNHMNLQRDSE